MMKLTERIIAYVNANLSIIEQRTFIKEQADIPGLSSKQGVRI